MEQTGHLNNDFRTCLAHLMSHGMASAPRGSETRELLNYNISLIDPRNRVITFKERNVNTKYLIGEFIWYLGASSMPEGILPYSKFWANITNSGKQPYYEAGTINSNYGTRIFGFSGLPAFCMGQPADMHATGGEPINQWNETIALLKRDKDSRQAIMNIHVPSDRHEGNKDVACTLTLQFLIRDDKLHMITNMRSNDIILGFTNDVFQFTMLQECLMLQLREFYPNLDLGHYYHNAGSMHVYSRHFDMTENIINTENAIDISMIPMDRFDEGIRSALLAVELAWRDSDMPEEFDFDSLTEWNELTPYWQQLVKAMFLKDEESLHFIFGQVD